MTPQFLPPLLFTPILKEKIWGGHMLQRHFGKHAPASSRIGESWELSGYESNLSVASGGPCNDATLKEIMAAHGGALMGTTGTAVDFPLLYKLIDATDKLSVQVHPDDTQARGSGWGANGKTECWYIIEATPGAKIICGFNRDVTVKEIRERIETSTLEAILNYIDISAGDLLFVPAGTVHAICEGTVLYETQQSSDATFRLYDWGRRDEKGAPRQLHIEQALAVIDTSAHSFHKIPPIEIPFISGVRHSFRAACRYFALEEYVFPVASRVSLPRKHSFQAMIILEGAGELHFEGGVQAISKGQSVLLPACLRAVDIAAAKGTRFLVSSVPDLRNEVIDVLHKNGISHDHIRLLGGNPKKNDLMPLLSKVR